MAYLQSLPFLFSLPPSFLKQIFKYLLWHLSVFLKECEELIALTTEVLFIHRHGMDIPSPISFLATNVPLCVETLQCNDLT